MPTDNKKQEYLKVISLEDEQTLKNLVQLLDFFTTKELNTIVPKLVNNPQIKTTILNYL